MAAPRHDDSGFSLVELMTVMVVLGVLAGIAIPTFLGQREKAFRSVLVSDLRSIVLAENARAVDGEPMYTDDLAELRQMGFAASERVVHRVYLSPDGSRFTACVKHEGVAEWLVYSSANGTTSYAPSECAAPSNAT